jgi:hypothetical protein
MEILHSHQQADNKSPSNQDLTSQAHLLNTKWRWHMLYLLVPILPEDQWRCPLVFRDILHSL